MKCNLLVAACLGVWAFGCPALAAEESSLTILRPQPYEVFQRIGAVPQLAGPHEPRGAARGFARVPITLQGNGSPDAIYRVRAIPLDGAFGAGTDWSPVEFRPTTEPTTDGQVTGTFSVPAGGWYRLEIEVQQEGKTLASGTIEPFGVGEVFMVAGQSYATNCNDHVFSVTEPQNRVVAYDTAQNTWRIAHDPQPVADNSDGGSIWPLVGDQLAAILQVPVAFANVAVGGTSSTQCLPNGPLHQRLLETGRELGQFRAVLWQQGESDVIDHLSTAQYVEQVQKIRQEAVAGWAFQPTWLLAKSTLHPTVYTDEPGEARIRRGIDVLAGLPGFQAGPDTDLLDGESRGGDGTRRHFSKIGQQRAAAMWFATLLNYVQQPRPAHEAVMPQLAQWHLLEPAWLSPVVYGESTVLLQSEAGSITARLAFPASEILEIRTADGAGKWTSLSEHVSLSEDGLTLTFTGKPPVEVIPEADFFLPKDAPNSYRHRAGNPEQNLLYRPGRWFHDRNLEITYRRQDAAKRTSAEEAAPAAAEVLPRTMARLKAGQPLTLGISGDSISTGADASGIAQIAPFQPGFADLVAAQLQLSTGSPVTLRNRAVGGWSVANGVQDLGALLAEKPDLIVVAYGMNDVGRRDPKWFHDRTQEIIQRIQQERPEADIILVSPMLGHNEWVHTPREMFALYRDQLKALTGPGIALADLTDVWTIELQHKHDFDLTGNGLNHPNDFGHRLYAQAILHLLVK